MDIAQIKKWLHKMEQILEVYSGNEGFTQTEKDLLLDYNRRIKDQINAIQISDEEPSKEPIETKKPEQKHNFEKQEDIKAEPAPVFHEIPEPSVIQHIPAEKPVQEIETAPARPPIHMYDELFDHLKLTDLSSKLEARPVTDIRIALGLNERIVALNELFKGDKNAFDDTIDKLNSMTNFENARLYLCEHIIPKYNWVAADKEESVNKFIKIVSRRYL